MPEYIAAEDKVGLARTRVTYTYAFLAFASLLIFGALHVFIEGNPTLGYLEIIGGLTFLLSVAAIKLAQNVKLACNLVIGCILGMMIVMLLTGGTRDTGIFWSFIFPVSAFFLTDKKTGLYWMAAFFGAIVLIMAGAHFELLETPYSLVTLRQLLVTLAVVTVGIYVYQQSREATANAAHKSDVASRENQLKADLIVDTIGEGVIATDAEGRIVRVNKAAAHMLGWEAKDLEGQLFIDAVPMLDKADHRITETNRPIAHSLQQSKDVQFEAKYLRKDGQPFLAHITSQVINVEGKVRGALITFRDTSAERLIDRTKSEFVTLASHQLRTPISAIAWIGELLLHGDAGKLTPEQAEYVEQIYRSNKRMAALVDAMLTTSSLELGNLPVRPEQIDLAKICREVLVDRFDALPTNKVLHVKEQYDPNLPLVSFDPNVVKTILQNLLANAFKYTPTEGTVTVTIKAEGPDVILEVADTGVGVPEGQQSKMFTKLFRADNIKHQDTDGTGLGLYIVKTMTEYVGGRITFVSHEHKGSTFTVYLPREGMPAKDGRS